MARFNYLVRFRDAQDNIHYGEAGDIGSESTLIGKTVDVYTGGNPWDDDFRLSGDKATIAEVLCPLARTPIIHGVGLNYKAHADEGNVRQPFNDLLRDREALAANIKVLSDTLANPYEDIPINKEGWQLDYEGEPCVIIGRDCKNLSDSDNPFDYVLGYSVGNDVSSRYWQDKARSSGQHGYGKSMDKFCPLGPVISSTDVIGDPSKLKITTHVNGELRQKSGTDNMIFDVPSLIRHLSRGMTLRRGTIIMTGTPDGVAAFMKPSPWLKNGDVVQIEISSIGQIRNKMVFEDDYIMPTDDRAPGF